MTESNRVKYVKWNLDSSILRVVCKNLFPCDVRLTSSVVATSREKVFVKSKRKTNLMQGRY
ncbi:hypothetical protein DCO58_09780 [Helicobacter saguini]|uniref:Uncharacterized protein n=1 Tax=Helicobacter saguini TaxID=1548018 RepID=A0A347VPE6_9HELI|nr:hypothetical protein [Helicobacter saguini]MWV61395.1 hypothetical protein [Helicobacter saguini]MWV67937.1 hypothetical protein [Helicobacter saguini]MWV70596.1 hypothetical protein [Helicobacter saguini]MWV72500.1 hypothetical protein [Helicobacter saguini]TLD94754.1 hypothetical protein LS64_004355 [Helicobacter saguini]